MEMNMAKFSEKLAELIELAKKKKNVLNTRKSMIFSRIFLWIRNTWIRFLTIWKPTV